MIAAKFDPQKLFSHPDAVAFRCKGSDLTGLLKRTLTIPRNWSALVQREEGASHVIPGGQPLSMNDADELLFARSVPVDLVCSVDGVESSDGFLFRGEVSQRVSIPADSGDMLTFQRAAMSARYALFRVDLSKLIEPALRAGLAKYVAENPADVVADPVRSADAATSVRSEVEPVCFAWGLLLEADPVIKVASPDFERVRKAKSDSIRQQHEHAAAQPLREARAQSQRSHLEHLDVTLAKIRQMAHESPATSVGDLIKTFSEHERAELYGALFKAEKPSATTRWVVVAAAEYLLFFDRSNLREPVRQMRISGAPGRARSILFDATAGDGPTLFVGAATGVYRWPVDRAEPDRTYRVPGAPGVRGGFNSVAVCDGVLLASHSELGVWSWRCGEADSMQQLLRTYTSDASAVRGMVTHDGTAFVSIDDRVMSWRMGDNPDEKNAQLTGVSGIISALCPTAGGLYAGTDGGDIWLWNNLDEAKPERVYRGHGRPVESIIAVQADGVERLFFADTSISVQARVIGDSYACRYEAGGQTLRRVEVAPDLLVATNDLRDRLICWSPSQPERPETMINIAAMCGHSVQDVCLVPNIAPVAS